MDVSDQEDPTSMAETKVAVDKVEREKTMEIAMKSGSTVGYQTRRRSLVGNGSINVSSIVMGY